MLWFTLGVIGIHLAVYLVTVRGIVLCQQEKWILLYHVGLAGAVTLANSMAWWWAVGNSSLSDVCGSLALNGIYSLSFLELWSLAQGSYSLQILGALVK